MLSAVLFDLGDTLFHADEDVERAAARAQWEAMQERGYTIDWEQYVDVAERVQDRFGRQDRDDPFKYQDGSWMEMFFDIWGEDAPDQEVQAIDAVYWDVKMREQDLVEGAEEVLLFCRAECLKLGVVTNGNEQMTYSRLERTGLREVFDAIVFSTGVGAEKHELEPFSTALDRLDVAPGLCLMVGDQRDEDMMAAKLGMKTVWVTRYASDAAGPTPDHTVESLDEVIGIIKSYVE